MWQSSHADPTSLLCVYYWGGWLAQWTLLCSRGWNTPICQVFVQSPELFLAAVLSIHDCGQNDKAIYMLRKKNHPVIFCVLSSERTHSSQHLPNKSHCQEDVDTKGLKEIMEAEIRMKSLPDCQDCAGLLRATPHFSSTKTMQRPSKAAGIQSNTNKMTTVLPVEW